MTEVTVSTTTRILEIEYEDPGTVLSVEVESLGDVLEVTSEVVASTATRTLEIEYEDAVDSVVNPGTILSIGVEEVVLEVASEGLQGPRGPAGEPGEPGGGVTEEQVEVALLGHELDPTPHPAYDDFPSLVLTFENGLI